jgi:hypothetical protein
MVQHVWEPTPTATNPSTTLSPLDVVVPSQICCCLWAVFPFGCGSSGHRAPHSQKESELAELILVAPYLVRSEFLVEIAVHGVLWVFPPLLHMDNNNTAHNSATIIDEIDTLKRNQTYVRNRIRTRKSFLLVPPVSSSTASLPSSSSLLGSTLFHGGINFFQELPATLIMSSHLLFVQMERNPLLFQVLWRLTMVFLAPLHKRHFYLYSCKYH